MPPIVGFDAAPDLSAEDEAIPVYRPTDDERPRPRGQRRRAAATEPVDDAGQDDGADQPDEQQPDDDDEETITEVGADDEDDDEEDDGTERPPEAAGAGAEDDEPTAQEVADYWYRRHQEEAQRRKELEERLSVMAGTGPTTAPTGSAPPSGRTPMPSGGPLPQSAPAPTAPPTLDEIAERLGSYPDDPAVRAVFDQAVRAHGLEQRLSAMGESLQPLLNQQRQQHFEGLMQRAFGEWISDPAVVDPQFAGQMRELYPFLREYLMRGEAKSFPRALDLYRADYERSTAPQREREAGRRQGFTEATRRNQTARLANVASGTRSTKTTTGPRMMDLNSAIDAGFAATGR